MTLCKGKALVFVTDFLYVFIINYIFYLSIVFYKKIYFSSNQQKKI